MDNYFLGFSKVNKNLMTGNTLANFQVKIPFF